MRTQRKTSHKKKSASNNQFMQIKITLLDSKPPIWRRVIVSEAMKLDQFHRVIQIAMGWEDSHLHAFFTEGKGRNCITYQIPFEDFDFDPSETMDERKHSLSDLQLNEKDSFFYEYDFGDTWEHQLLVEKLLPSSKEVKHPICLEASMACPPEDSGGMWGYYNMLEIIQDSTHEEHENYKEWLGADFDPQHVDLKAINKHLSRLKLC